MPNLESIQLLSDFPKIPQLLILSQKRCGLSKLSSLRITNFEGPQPDSKWGPDSYPILRNLTELKTYYFTWDSNCAEIDETVFENLKRLELGDDLDEDLLDSLLKFRYPSLTAVSLSISEDYEEQAGAAEKLAELAKRFENVR
eukprot:28813_1